MLFCALTTFSRSSVLQTPLIIQACHCGSLCRPCKRPWDGGMGCEAVYGLCLSLFLFFATVAKRGGVSARTKSHDLHIFEKLFSLFPVLSLQPSRCAILRRACAHARRGRGADAMRAAPSHAMDSSPQRE